MCYSLNASKSALYINIISCFVLYFSFTKETETTHKILALFFFFVGFMQLFDWIFWENQNTIDSDQAYNNYVFTKIAMIFNHLQPIVFGLLIWYFTNKIGYYSKIILVIYSLFISSYTINAYSKINYTLTRKVKNKEILYWEWNYLDNYDFIYILFLLCLSIIAFENFEYPLNMVLTCFCIFSLLFSVNKHNSVGRFWCNFTSVFPLFLVVLIRMFPNVL